MLVPVLYRNNKLIMNVVGEIITKSGQLKEGERNAMTIKWIFLRPSVELFGAGGCKWLRIMSSGGVWH